MIAAISFYWCELISAANYKLGCIPRPGNFYKSTIGTVTRKPFNPFIRDTSLYSQTLSELELLNPSIKRFTDSRIKSIKIGTTGTTGTN